MEGKRSKHQHHEATEAATDALQGAQETQASSVEARQSEEQCLQGNRLRDQIQPQRRKMDSGWLDISHLIPDLLIWMNRSRRNG